MNKKLIPEDSVCVYCYCANKDNDDRYKWTHQLDADEYHAYFDEDNVYEDNFYLHLNPHAFKMFSAFFSAEENPISEVYEPDAPKEDATEEENEWYKKLANEFMKNKAELESSTTIDYISYGAKV